MALGKFKEALYDFTWAAKIEEENLKQLG